MCFQPLFTNFIYLLLSLFKKKKRQKSINIYQTQRKEKSGRERNCAGEMATMISSSSTVNLPMTVKTNSFSTSPSSSINSKHILPSQLPFTPTNHGLSLRYDGNPLRCRHRRSSQSPNAANFQVGF